MRLFVVSNPCKVRNAENGQFVVEYLTIAALISVILILFWWGRLGQRIDNLMSDTSREFYSQGGKTVDHWIKRN